MDISVQTGHTKSVGGIKLLATGLKSNAGEKVCILLQVHASAQEAKTLEKESLSIVKNALLDTEGEPGSRLDGTLKELNGLFKGLLLARKIDDIHAIIAIVDSDHTLHVSHAGRAEAYVVRAGAASQITEYTRGKPTPAFVHIASGVVEPKDVLIFSTQRLLRTLTPAQLAQNAVRGDQLLDELTIALEAEKEMAAIGIMHVEGVAPSRSAPLKQRSDRRRSGKGQHAFSQSQSIMTTLMEGLKGVWSRIADAISSLGLFGRVSDKATGFVSDLKDPAKKKRANMFLLAGILAVFLIVWMTVNLSTYSQRSKTRAELEQLIEEIETDLRTAENRYLTGEVDSSNAILQRAEERAKQVMDNEDKLFRSQAHDLLGRIRTKREEINNIIRLSPRTVVSLTGKNQNVSAEGLIGLADGEFAVYDQTDIYRVLLNSIEDPDSITNNEQILHGVSFPRYQTLVFQTNANSVIELIADQPTSMKTEDPAGWITGKDMEAWLRYMYVLSPENNQIYKYERYSNRYAAPSEYNVNGDLNGAIDMTIDGNVYVLKEHGEVVKLFRGEQRPFVIRHLPGSILENATKVFKVLDGNLYFLDSANKRVIVVADGGATGESTYIRQYVLEGEIDILKDIYVDPDESRLYVLDSKSIYAVDLGNK
ncbi:hypothetical protein COU78_06305 [Candidatus Peregrinibacteria bacterium CG10_big_fil_rev_8_21_14_0_10_49_24]|nr:MAG: hypothetical protein COV83_03135 [Candidatus Peregrinibacteria bacterium CG11_big_fil_rev_8_21_14_0_20_49_14]PIR50463.1 MAG: hypothetical protein COU78_06305 [Candidatus Peregrinibacteria bacterium CG10_big_fil_rev_8_21_14_0_10_49_24]PJA68299.1 MAG: hypothetical protein CO157_00295 [Candidatus Peregrinibacteria bacterium CG_4_9_14_3_um_filter_49_12]